MIDETTDRTIDFRTRPEPTVQSPIPIPSDPTRSTGKPVNYCDRRLDF